MEQELELYKNHDFLTWFKGECDRQKGHLEMLDRAERVSKNLLHKPISECLTYETRYIARMIAKGIF
jgi:hypothetical protein